MPSEDPIEVVRCWYLEVLSGPADIDITSSRSTPVPGIGQLFSADYINHVVPAPKDGWKTGVAGARQVLKSYRSSFPDLKIEIDKQWMEEGKVMTQYTVNATHTGTTFCGVKASGNHYRVSGLGIDRIENGKFVESWGHWDMQSLLAQMNVPPDAGEIT